MDPNPQLGKEGKHLTEAQRSDLKKWIEELLEKLKKSYKKGSKSSLVSKQASLRNP